MPREDGTGPMGEGPMTGRGLGPCADGSAIDYGPRPGMGYGRGYGRRAFGRGRRFYGRGFGWGYGVEQVPAATRKEYLQERKEYLQRNLEVIDDELEKL